MFRETDKRTRLESTGPEALRTIAQPAAPPRDEAAALNALLGRGSEFEGKLSFQGAVRIDGKFTGSIATDDDLIIGEGALVCADIACGSVVVQGELTGNVRAASAVELRSPARVKGEITTPSLVVEKGVIFEGQSRMESVSAGKVIPIGAAADSAD